MKTEHIRLLNLYGEKLGNEVAGTTADITVLERDYSGNISRATGTDVPTDDTAGYAKGCVFIDTDVAAGTGGRYTNVGTTLLCNFDLEGTISALSVDTAQIAADAIDGTKIADDAVSAEHLDAGLLPSHVVKYAGEITWSGGSASTATTVAGVLATDIVQATLQTVPSEAGYIASCAASENTITTVLSANNSSNDAVVAYTVFRAVV